MRKLLYVMFLVLPVFVFGAGPSPQSESADFDFILPTIVAVFLSSADITWNFGTMAGFPPVPPDAFPQYYEPNVPVASPDQTITYMVLFAGGAAWQLTVAGLLGGPTPACGIDLDEIEYEDPDIGWTPFTVAQAPLDNGTGSIIRQRNHNYRVEIDGDEDYTGTSSCVITYTIQSP